MPRKSLPQSLVIMPANLPIYLLPEAIRKLQKRLEDFETSSASNFQGSSFDYASNLCNKLDGTLAEIFGINSLEYKQTHMRPLDFAVMRTGHHSQIEYADAFNKGRERALSRIRTMIEQLQERLDDEGASRPAQVLKAYEGLALHTEIERATSDLYRNGHFANAIEDAVKVLNALVRLRSDLELDGASLMERAFAPNNPILRFNDLADQSDKDEQKGFMMMFSGAVAGLRNPRAHKLIKDDPERALEFIAYISLLAKLLDGVRKN